MRFKNLSNRRIYVEMIDSVTQELQDRSSMGLVSTQIETCIDLMQAEAHTLARNRAESADTASHQSLQAMSDMENELCNLVFIMKVLLEQVRRTDGPIDEEVNPPSCFYVDEEEHHVPSPSSNIQISNSLQIQDALDLLQGSRERINSLVLDNNIVTKQIESQVNLQSLENVNKLSRKKSLTVIVDGDQDRFDQTPKCDSLSTLRPRLPTIIDDIIAHNVQEKIDDQATLSRSSDRHVGIEIRMKGLGFSVICSTNDRHRNKVKTVYNQSFPYKLLRFVQRTWRKIFIEKKGDEQSQLEERFILNDINLHLKPGKSYLILGPPASGKTSLLKAIASLLDGQTVQREDGMSRDPNRQGCVSDVKNIKRKGDTCIHGTISYDGFAGGYRKEREVRSSVVFVDQMDHHAPRLTVQEIFDFAFQCKTGGTHSPQIRWHRALMRPRSSMAQTFQGFFRNMDKHNTFINVLLEGLDLHHVKNTFVGDATNVRGVSGGQRRRVSIGEMLSTSITSSTAIFCGDEISTGLDAASSYDIVYRLCRMGSALKRTNILSLLQPSPETLKCFDEIILLSQGRLIFSGPAEDAVQWFTSLGYHRPPSIDVADYLLLVASHYDGVESFFGGENNDISTLQNVDTSSKTIYDSKTLADLFKRQCRHSSFHDSHGSSSSERMHQDEETGVSVSIITRSKKRYRNSFFRFVKLNTARSFTIWKRDKRFVRINIIKNIVMGISVGSVFFHTKAIDGVFGVLFQGMLFIMLGSMTAAPEQLADRAIFYKHQDADLYPTLTYVLGRTIALVPQAVLDCTVFGTLLYWMVGLAASAEAFLLFLVILIVFTLAMNQTLSVFSSFAPSKAVVLALSSLTLIFLMLFSGFIVSPDVIPHYFVWFYWLNPLAWAYRALLVIEFKSDKYSSIAPGHGNYTKGDMILLNNGFDLGEGRPFTMEWIGYTVIYLLAFYSLTLILCAVCLQYVRASSDQTPAAAVASVSSFVKDDNQAQCDIALNCNPVELTFRGICYDVKTSKGSQTLRLLNDVSGYFRGGRMCALMGSSGAGKTTLMDVIALRKTHGLISGEVRLNGVLQDKKSFPRYSGYVEQFDVQSAELTVRETVLFSAQLRLDQSHPAATSSETRNRFVNEILDILELSSYSNHPVGSYEDNVGLTFEQRKRLSIAVELAASPSILFLDEPTSGLDSRAAMFVIRALKKIARTGRTICCTIHQPSSVVFELFDDLLLLRKGEVVWFGELGLHSCNLIQYFESIGAPTMPPGENPSTWMLDLLSKSKEDDSPNFIQCYRSSYAFESLHNCLDAVDARCNSSDLQQFKHKYARSLGQRNLLMARRLGLIYWRSPSYNYSRMLLCIFMGVLLSSVFFANARPSSFTETAIKSIISTIFLSFILVGVLSITTVLPVMIKIRDVFYRHRAAGMLDHNSLFWALAYAEMKFIIYASFLFCICFYFGIGFQVGPLRFAAFWSFFTFNLAIYSYFGQAFVCCVRGMGTAQILAAVFIGLNNLFSGLIVRPQYLSGFWQAPYWITPGHYVFEGLIVTQFQHDSRPVVASEGSVFHQYLLDHGTCTSSTNSSSSVGQCVGTVSQYVNSFFGGQFQHSHIYSDAIILGVYLVIPRLLTYVALRKFNFMAT